MLNATPETKGVAGSEGTRRGSLWPRRIRDLHLYVGLFISPFVLLFSVSVFFLVHNCLPKAVPDPTAARTVAELPLPPDVAELSGRERIVALKPALDWAGVHGEVGWIQHRPKDHRLIVPVTVPGRLTTVTIDLETREASIVAKDNGLANALVVLHKSPGPHLVGLRMNWFPMRIWFWLADATVYLVLFLTLSGVYLWLLLRSERRIGVALLSLGAVSFLGLAYAIVH